MPSLHDATAAPVGVRENRRRSRRRPLPGVIVAAEQPENGRFIWAGNVVDINGDGLAMSVPPEVDEGIDVLLTFRLDDYDFARLPAVVVRQDREYGVGALRFGSWPEPPRLALLDSLLGR